MMNLVPNNVGRSSARHRQVPGLAGVATDAETPTDVRFVPLSGTATTGSAEPSDPAVDDPDREAGVPSGVDDQPLDGSTHNSATHPHQPVSGERNHFDPRGLRPPLTVVVAAPALTIVILAALTGLYARQANIATDRVAAQISSAHGQYRVAADADRAVSRARVAANQGTLTAESAALERADLVLSRQSDALKAIVARSDRIPQDNSSTEPLAALLASDRSYVDVSSQLIELAGRSPAAARAALSSNRDFYEQRLEEHESLSAALSDEIDRLTRRLADQRSGATIMFPVLPLALVMVGIGLVWWTRRSIVGPLRHVAQTLEHIAQGQFRVRSHLVGNDDLGRVGRATDRMAGRLGDRFSSLSDDARRNTQNRVISESLEITDSEPATFAVVERALSLFAPGLPGELLLIDAETGDLGEVAASPSSGSPGCPVKNPADCVALRRGQTVVFDSSESINGCPKLRGRPDGPISAVCVPMTFNSDAIGVVHLTGPDHRPPDIATTDQFVELASQTATHIGALRTLEFTRRQASTDALTGLPNRQAVASRVDQFLAQRTSFALVIADLDRFKSINDRFGHEAGDRALQVFAAVMSENVRSADMVGRFGGDEFIMICPELSVAGSIEATQRLRSALAEVIGASGITPFTASFGVAHSALGTNFNALVRVADAGLRLAKDQDRDRTVSATPELAEQVFPDGGFIRGGHRPL